VNGVDGATLVLCGMSVGAEMRPLLCLCGPRLLPTLPGLLLLALTDDMRGDLAPP
jgi:hypothetical protein